MSPAETAALLGVGVTWAMIQSLEADGHDSIAEIAAMSRERLAAVPGLSEDDARIVRRDVGRLVDVALAEGGGVAR